MTHFAERTDVVDAVQWQLGVEHPALLNLGSAANVSLGGKPMAAGVYIMTAQGAERLTPGMWIVTDRWGDVSLITSYEFRDQYVRVVDDTRRVLEDTHS